MRSLDVRLAILVLTLPFFTTAIKCYSTGRVPSPPACRKIIESIRKDKSDILDEDRVFYYHIDTGQLPDLPKENLLQFFGGPDCNIQVTIQKTYFARNRWAVSTWRDVLQTAARVLNICVLDKAKAGKDFLGKPTRIEVRVESYMARSGNESLSTNSKQPIESLDQSRNGTAAELVNVS